MIQTIQDNNGIATGVFIPIENWNLIVQQYPNIKNTSDELLPWQKKIIDDRLLDMHNNHKLKPIAEFYTFLDAEL